MRLCNEMDEKAFEQKASQLRAKAVATCLSAGATNDEANDVAQEVMLRLWQMRQSLEKYRSVEALATVMARHELVNLHRGYRNVPLMSIPATKLQSSMIEPDQSLISSQEVSWLNEAMYQLPSTQYTVLHMRQVENLSYTEIARTLGIAESSARSLLSRARLKLLEEIKKRNLR